METKCNLNMLLGCELFDIGRAADLIWWAFSKGKEAYDLHTQCSCRIKYNGDVILTRSSIYYYEDEEAAEAEDSHKMLFDYLVRNIVRKILPITVTKIHETATHDIIIEATDDVLIEIFADQPTTNEQWRLFNPEDSGPHLVAYTDHTAYE